MRLLRLIMLSMAAAAVALPAVAQETDFFELEEQAVKAAVERVAPSVVQIETIGGLERVGKVLIGEGPTTGLIVSEDGYILSSAFNFIQKPTSVLVRLADGKRLAAKIVARDQARMLVLLKVEPESKLPAATTVARKELQVGQTAIAVGRTFDETPNISTGIVSAKNRIWGKAVQTDAKISPANYGGPLVDLRGRVIGLLVPLSPQGTGEVAGAEWYDSGIGFATPVDEVMARFETLKSGEDLKPGVLGVSLARGDIYDLPAKVANVQPNSPAAEAGLQAGDVIVEIDGYPIDRQSKLKHALGGKYAGDEVHIIARRGEKKIDSTVALTDQLEPYRHPFLGVLPRRDADGVVIRYVYPDSPAAEAGLQAGDRLTALGEEPIQNAAELRDAVAALRIGDAPRLKFTRNGAEKSVTPTLAALPEAFPGELPPAVGDLDEAPERPAVGLVDVKLPEERNEGFAYVPENYHPEVPHALIIWLHPPGGVEKAAFVQRWKEAAKQHRLIVLAPLAADPQKWVATETAFIRKAADSILGQYNVDSSRVVVQGYQAGGSLGMLFALQNRELVTGVVAVDAPPPLRAQTPANDPIQRLAFVFAVAEKSAVAPRVKQAIERFREAKFPVTELELGEQPRQLNAEELRNLARWVDALDRI